MPDYYTGYWDEERLRGIPSPQPSSSPSSESGPYSGPYAGLSPDGVTPLLINQGTYTNGHSFAGTGSRSNPGSGNVPMSDASYQLLMSNLGQIPTDRDVLGGGKFGVRGWLNDHPVGTIAAFIAAAAGGAALSGAGAGAGGSSSLTTLTPAEQAAITSGLTNVPAGVGAGGAGTVAGFGGAGTAGIPADLAADLAGTQLGAAGNGLVLEGGAGTISGSGALNAIGKYGDQLGGLFGGGGSGGAAPSLPPIGMLGSPAPVQTQQRPQFAPLNQTMQRSRWYMRTPINYRGATIWL